MNTISCRTAALCEGHEVCHVKNMKILIPDFSHVTPPPHTHNKRFKEIATVQERWQVRKIISCVGPGFKSLLQHVLTTSEYLVTQRVEACGLSWNVLDTATRNIRRLPDLGTHLAANLAHVSTMLGQDTASFNLSCLSISCETQASASCTVEAFLSLYIVSDIGVCCSFTYLRKQYQPVLVCFNMFTTTCKMRRFKTKTQIPIYWLQLAGKFLCNASCWWDVSEEFYRVWE